MVGRLLLRTTVGGLMVGHGAQKLLGAFGGEGLGKTAEFFEQTGLKPGLPYAVAGGLSEAAGGAGLVLGAQTPLAAAAVISTMATAIDRVHYKNGLWAQQGGYEYPLVLIAAAATLAELGPGKLSLDARKGHKRSGTGWGVLALGLGVGGAAALRFVANFIAPSDDAGGEGDGGEPVVAAEPQAVPEPGEPQGPTVVSPWESRGVDPEVSSTTLPEPGSVSSTAGRAGFDPQRPTWGDTSNPAQ